MTAKDLKRLNKAYKNRLSTLQKSFFDNNETGLLLFAEYLRYLRDSIVLAEYRSETEAAKIKIATITAAVAELDAYLQDVGTQHKTFHWNTFCELLKQNMEDWLKIDDSV